MHALKSMWVRTHWEFQCDDLTEHYLVDFQMRLFWKKSKVRQLTIIACAKIMSYQTTKNCSSSSERVMQN